MKINKILLENFRQFYGKQEVVLAADDKKNVTLIHAENGFGKTTILNAILWAFYNKTTPKFEQPEKILNFEAEAEGEKFASVSVEFEYNSEIYLISRNFNNASISSDKTSLNGYKVEKGGWLSPLSAPKTFIESVVPPEMATYFFFDGESAESFSSATNFKVIGEAIRNILGAALADTAIADLKEVRKVIDRELGQTQSVVELRLIEEKLFEKTEQLEQAFEFKKNFKTDITTYKAQRDEIVRELRSLEATQQIQMRRDEKQRDLAQIRADIVEAQEEVVKWIGQRSLSLVSRRLAQETSDFINDARTRRKIPSPYNETFVKELLEDQICICGREIKAGTPEWQLVANLLSKANNAEIENRISQARSRIFRLKDEAGDAPKVLESINNKLSRLMIRRDQLEQEIAELSQQIQNLPVEDIAAKERARRDLDFKIDKENQKLGEMEAGIRKLETEKSLIEKDLEKTARSNKQAKRLLIRRKLIEDGMKFLGVFLKGYEEEARKTIEKQVNSILEQVAHRDYKCKLNPDFSIELTFADGRSTPKSGGENQLLSLVFIASLVKFAASRANKDDLILKPGTIAPLVLDAPFGQLDTTYQESTATWIPQLAQQVVLLVSSSQGNEKVLKALDEFIGEEYILISENKARMDGKKETSVVVKGEKIATSLFSQPKDMTRVQKI
jgi:DNA sulfur modification protein DndD